ncbi:hypothetical protein HYY70_02450 [Candidatus Woesearchaeota archaeon]|nr:hypothetical protein [Candidatus Woesearchaeota archaeon]
MEGPVLVVDDDQDFRDTLEEGLKRENILVLPYGSHSGAIEAIKEGIQYKVALVDLSSQRGERYHGLDVRDESKKVHPSVPVMILSGYAEILDNAEGIDAVFSKGTRLDGLIRKVKSWLST